MSLSAVGLLLEPLRDLSSVARTTLTLFIVNMQSGAFLNRDRPPARGLGPYGLSLDGSTFPSSEDVHDRKSLQCTGSPSFFDFPYPRHNTLLKVQPSWRNMWAASRSSRSAAIWGRYRASSLLRALLALRGGRASLGLPFCCAFSLCVARIRNRPPSNHVLSRAPSARLGLFNNADTRTRGV